MGEGGREGGSEGRLCFVFPRSEGFSQGSWLVWKGEGGKEGGREGGQ